MRVRELPILFNDEMVQALLTGRKTCTRRAIELPDKMTGRPIGKSEAEAKLKELRGNQNGKV